ncbi:MAG TPA: hypothetical protein VFP50_00070 [Anaeromyxobacteraceae bacterium]|nr:hypothetical protein [Anaeromyxobacteraceae bacterium]
MRTRVALVLSLLLAACSKKMDGPAPTLTSLNPDVVCNQQLTTGVTVAGTGLSPTVESAAKDKLLYLPKVTLTPRTALDGTSASGAAIAVPDDPTNAAASHVAWTSQQALRFDVYPGLAVPNGIYDLTVKNPNGQQAALTGALAAVPPPTLSTVAPAAVCHDASALPVVITGADFLVFGANTATPSTPTVTIGGQNYTSVASQCVDLPGFPGVQRCTVLTVTVNGALFTVGQTVQVTVTNPPPANCVSASQPLVITAPPTLAAVAPITVCATGGVLGLTGTGFEAGASVTIDGAAPGGGNAAATTVSVTDPTNATATFAPAAADAMVPSATPYPVTIHNPDGCSATKPAAVTVKPAPALFFVDPAVVYNGIVTQATIYGSGIALPIQSVAITIPGGTPIDFLACGANAPPCFTTDPAHPNRIQIQIPLNTVPGTYDVDVMDSTSGCPNAHLAAGLKVTNLTTLALATPAIDPGFGWTGGTTAVTVASTFGSTLLPGARVYLNPSTATATTVATALGAVAKIDDLHLSALVPSGLPIGTYDVIVVNPDGSVGVKTGAFQVTAQPPPTVVTVSPGQLPTNAAQPATIVGTNFRTPAVSFACFDGAGASIAGAPSFTASGAPICDAAQRCTLSGTLSFATAAACVVRVTNGDDGTFGEFSAVAFTAPAGNLAAAITQGGTPPATFRLSAGGRAAPVVLGGDATSAARFLHVVGGQDATGAALGTVETSALASNGQPTGFAVQRSQLVTPRTYAAGALATIGGSRRYLYVAGGSQTVAGTTTRLDSVERAAVLEPNERGNVVDLQLEVDKTAGVGPGLWYYRVAAVLGPTDPVNPGGENLPSDPFPVQLPDLGATKVDVTVAWASVPNAVKYRVYRSATRADVAGGPIAGDEVVVAEVTAPATTCQDTGAAQLAGVTDHPLPVGSLGAWSQVATLSVPREGPGVAFLADPAVANKGYLYVLGGRSDATTALASYELLPITFDPATGVQTVGALTAGANPMTGARWRFGAVAATSDLSTRISPATPFVYALAGENGTGGVVNDVVAATVGANGQLQGPTTTWYDVGPTSQLSPGSAAIMAGFRVFGFGGVKAGAPTNGIPSAIVCAPGQSGCATNPNPPFVVNWNAGQTLSVARGDVGGTLSGAFIYMVGGSSTGSPALDTVEYFVW